ncbi:MAG: hypothetical protein ABF991_00400 [Liquorilactobacillus hordei]|uniref:hypothetical protein n=1 Tax=Liquorilactobacillus hordei TaxID=468911 RepID=UPI0039EA9CF1
MKEKLEIKKVKKHVDSVSSAYKLLSSKEWTPSKLFNFLYVKCQDEYTKEEREQINNLLSPDFTPTLSDYYKVGRYVKQLFEQDGYPAIQQGYVTSTDIFISKDYISNNNSFRLQIEIGSIKYEMRVAVKIDDNPNYIDDYGYFVIKPSIKRNGQDDLHYNIVISNIINMTEWEKDNNERNKREKFDKYNALRIKHSYFNLFGKWRWSNEMLKGSKEYYREFCSMAKNIKIPFYSKLLAIFRFNFFAFLFPNSNLSQLYKKGQDILFKHKNDYLDCSYSCSNLSQSLYLQKHSDLPKSFKKNVINNDEYKRKINDLVGKIHNIFDNILKKDNVNLVLVTTTVREKCNEYI